MDTEQAIRLIDARIDEIPSVKQGGRLGGRHVQWLQNLLFELSRLFGEKSAFVANLRQLTWTMPSGTPIQAPPWELSRVMAKMNEEYFHRDLERAEGILRSAIQQLRAVGLGQLRRESGPLVTADANKVFIAHGSAEDVLRHVEDYVRSLGCEPVVVKRLASGGAGIDDLVEQRIGECRAAIILATCDDEVGGRFQPRSNVIHEIGLAQRILDNRVVYLKEQGCELPSNVRPRVWEDFERNDLAPAYEKIAKELRAFGML